MNAKKVIQALPEAVDEVYIKVVRTANGDDWSIAAHRTGAVLSGETVKVQLDPVLASHILSEGCVRLLGALIEAANKAHQEAPKIVTPGGP